MIALHRICYFLNSRDGVYNDFIVVLLPRCQFSWIVVSLYGDHDCVSSHFLIHFIVVLLPRGQFSWIFVSL